MHFDPVAVVCVKTGPSAKLRLASVLDARARSALATSLALHVLDVVRAAGLRGVVAHRGPFEAPAGVEAWEDTGRGLNATLRDAVARTGVPVLVLPSDLPWVTAEDVMDLLAEPGDVVVAASEDGGTNGLLLRAPLAPSFGPRSALAHVAGARALGYRARVVSIPGLRRDLDTEGQLVTALRHSRTYVRGSRWRAVTRH